MEVHSHTRSNLKSIDLRKIAMSSYKARNLGKYKVLDPYRHCTKNMVGPKNVGTSMKFSFFWAAEIA